MHGVHVHICTLNQKSMVYHKGAIAPLYIGIVVVGQHRSHTFGKSAFLWQ